MVAQTTSLARLLAYSHSSAASDDRHENDADCDDDGKSGGVEGREREREGEKLLCAKTKTFIYLFFITN